MKTTATEALITMSMREVDRLKTVQLVVDRMLRLRPAAQRLGVSSRQLQRLVRRYRAEGAAGLVSRKRGRPSNHQLNPGLTERALALVRDRYRDFGPTLACEKLRECHGVVLRDRSYTDDCRGTVGSTKTTRRPDPPASQPAIVPGRTYPD